VPSLIHSNPIPSTPGHSHSRCVHLSDPTLVAATPQSIPCLAELHARILALPATVPEASVAHPFAQFAGNLDGIVPEGEDAWEVWDGPLNRILQKESHELQMLVARGERGLIAFHNFLYHLATNYHVNPILFENKVARIIDAIREVGKQLEITDLHTDGGLSDDVHILSQNDLINVTLSQGMDGSIASLPIDVDQFNANPPQSQKHTCQCSGVLVKLPAGKNAHTAYPFALHESLGDPWDYFVSEGKMVLRARNCQQNGMVGDGSRCGRCNALSMDDRYLSILDRIQDGVKTCSPFAYHGTSGMIDLLRRKTREISALKLSRLNVARKLIRKATAISLYKEMVMAIGSGEVRRVDRLIKVALDNKRGIRGILELYHRAASDVYHVKSFEEKEKLISKLIWRFGGERVAEIAHRALGLPSVRTLRRNTIIPRLIASPGQPTVPEIEANVFACLNVLESVIGQISGTLHQVLMLDELKVEERPRWDDHTNYIQGICREHGRHASLVYTTNREVDMLFEQILDGSIHLATNVR